MGQGGERQRPDFAPLEHSRGLGTRVLVTTPPNRLGPLFVVTQVPLHHVVVPAAPTAIFSELNSCKDRAAVGQLEAVCSRPPALFLSSGELSRESIDCLLAPVLSPTQVTFYRALLSVSTGRESSGLEQLNRQPTLQPAPTSPSSTQCSAQNGL